MLSYGLALSGGALRGAAHIGFLEVFQENKLIPDVIAGTSAGSIIGSLYAAGMRPQQMLNLIQQLQKFLPLNVEELVMPSIQIPATRLTNWLPSGLISSSHIETFLKKLIGSKTFEQLNLPLAVVTADLYNGEVVVYTSEKLIPDKPWPGSTSFISGVEVAEAVRASCAIPGIFTPKTIGNRTLVDGGLVDNIPADILRFLGVEKVVAVDLGFAVYQTEPLKHLIDILLQTYDIMGQRISNFIIDSYADLIIKPGSGTASLLDFKKIPEFIESGRIAARKNLTAVKDLLA